MTDDRMTLDALLVKQAQPQPLLVTVEPVAGQDDLVTITPYSSASGCACSSSLKLPRSVVDWVRPTGDVHLCCGKRLSVVEIGLTDATWTDVLRQLSEQTSRSARTASRLPRTPSVSGFIGSDGIGSPFELQTGETSERTCKAARDRCLANTKTSVGEDREIAACVCWQQYYSCLNPRYEWIDCVASVGGPH